MGSPYKRVESWKFKGVLRDCERLGGKISGALKKEIWVLVQDTFLFG